MDYIISNYYINRKAYSVANDAKRTSEYIQTDRANANIDKIFSFLFHISE